MSREHRLDGIEKERCGQVVDDGKTNVLKRTERDVFARARDAED